MGALVPPGVQLVDRTNVNVKWNLVRTVNSACSQGICPCVEFVLTFLRGWLSSCHDWL
jgi:hypothetical protein